MTRLANKGSALSKIGLALALFGGLMLGGSVVARAQIPNNEETGPQNFLVNYFLRTTGGTDDIMTLVNGNYEVPMENQTPNLVSPDDFVPICANVYIFDREEEETGCCEVDISAGGMAILPINELVAGLNVAGSGVPNTGEIKVVATNGATSVQFVKNPLDPAQVIPTATALPCNAQAANEAFLPGFFEDQAGSTFGTFGALHGWITHTHSATIGSATANFVTETPLVDADEDDNDINVLKSHCIHHQLGGCCAVPGVAGAGGVCS